MKTTHRIYFDEKPFIIANHTEKEAFEKLVASPGTLLLQDARKKQFSKAIEDLDNGNVQSVIILCENTNEGLDLFSGNFKMIQAGGGLVKNEAGEYLFIFRRGKWDLPKGKLDKGETIAQCALREVMEETGLKQVKMLDHLCNTYHVYHDRGKFLMKESVWFNMTSSSKEALTPQVEEDIHDIKWIAPTGWSQVLENTFASIHDVLVASRELEGLTLE